MSTISGAVYSQEFMDSGYKDVISSGRDGVDVYITRDVMPDGSQQYRAHTKGDAYGVIDGWANGDLHISDYFSNTGVMNDKATVPMNIRYEEGQEKEDITLQFAALKQYVVDYQGSSNKISMVKRNGTIDPTADTVNVTGQELFGSNIFDNKNSGNQDNGASGGTASINDLFMVAAKMEAGDVKWLASQGITITDQAHAQVVEAQTAIAARQNVYDSVSTMLDKQNETITEDISNCSDADVAKLAIDLMTMQTIYNMSLSVGSRILPQSLADYL